MVESTQKTKRPPTFKHFPSSSAKKLKQEWVEKKKIRSKWRAEKRKLALAPGNEGREKIKDLNTQPEDRADVDESLQAKNETVQFDDSTLTAQPSMRSSGIRPTGLAYKEGRNRARESHKDNPPDTPGRHVREMAREAYSRSSLHTYKSNPFGKRRDIRRKSGDDDWAAQRRGQPNMKLRMNVVLEQIKRDCV